MPADALVGLTDGNALGQPAGTTYTKDKGTVPAGAKKKLYGDLGRMKLTQRVGTASIFISNNLSDSEKAPVAGKWSRSPRSNDEYCTGGYKTQQECGWVVEDPDTVLEARSAKTDPTVEYARPVVQGSKWGRCNIPGDSGGPVYTIVADGPAQGYITAKGIISGGKEIANGPCTAYFTDIRAATELFGGDIKKRKVS